MDVNMTQRPAAASRDVVSFLVPRPVGLRRFLAQRLPCGLGDLRERGLTEGVELLHRLHGLRFGGDALGSGLPGLGLASPAAAASCRVGHDALELVQLRAQFHNLIVADLELRL